MNRYIIVPFEEKDEAKALGAKWDSDKKLWYIPNGCDESLFSKWNHIYQSSVNYYFYIVEAKRECFRCEKDTTVIGMGVPYGEYYDLDEDSDYILGNTETFDKLAILPRFAVFPMELRQYLDREYSYKMKFSKFTNETLMNNTCNNCGTLQGENFLFHEVKFPFYCRTMEDVERLKFHRINLDHSLYIYGSVYRFTELDTIIFDYASKNHDILDIKIRENIFL